MLVHLISPFDLRSKVFQYRNTGLWEPAAHSMSTPIISYLISVKTILARSCISDFLLTYLCMFVYCAVWLLGSIRGVVLTKRTLKWQWAYINLYHNHLISYPVPFTLSRFNMCHCFFWAFYCRHSGAAVEFCWMPGVLGSSNDFTKDMKTGMWKFESHVLHLFGAHSKCGTCGTVT